MSKFISIVSVLITIICSVSNGQNSFDFYLKNDSLYRFNSSLKQLDSLLTIQTKQSRYDSSFYNSYGRSEIFTLNQLLFAAVNNNPDLVTMQTKIEASNSQANSISYLPDPMLEIELDDIMTDFNKVGMINFYISQMFPFPGKLALEKQSIMNSKAMMQSERLSMAVEIMNMIKMNYYDLYLVNKKLAVNYDSKLLLKIFIAAAEAQYMVGKGMQQEIFKSQAELLKLENDEFILKQQRKNIFSVLTKLTKITVDENTRMNFGDIDTDYLLDQNSFNISSTGNQKLIDFAFEHRPDLKTLQNKVIMNKTDLEMAKLDRLPDFNLKLGYKILPFEEKNAFAFMLGINIPFAPWSSGKYENKIMKNEILLKSTYDEISSKKNEIKSEITEIVNNMVSLKETMKFYYSVQIPQTENTMKSSQYSYENNMGSFLDLLDSYRMYQESRVMFYESVTMYLKMIAELEKAAGLNLKN